MPAPLCAHKLSHVWLCSYGLTPARLWLLCPWNPPAEYWSGLLFLPPEDRLPSRIKSVSPIGGGFFTTDLLPWGYQSLFNRSWNLRVSDLSVFTPIKFLELPNLSSWVYGFCKLTFDISLSLIRHSSKPQFWEWNTMPKFLKVFQQRISCSRLFLFSSL